MTNPEKIKYLNRYRNNERKIERLQEEIIQAEALSRKVTVICEFVACAKPDVAVLMAKERYEQAIAEFGGTADNPAQ